MGRHVFICEDNNENILTAIFDAFTYRNRFRTDDIDIIVSKDGTYMAELLATYERVETDMSKAFKTMDAVRQKLGVEAHVSVLRVLCHYDDRRAYYIFRFLERCFRFGGDYAMKLSDEYVMKMMELSRKTWNEAHLFRGFVRFEETKGFLYATIEPKCNVIPLIMDHFADRFPAENWVISDSTRNIMAVHKAYEEPVMVTSDGEMTNSMEIRNNEPAIRDGYEDLWKVFFDSIAIKERTNPRCQQTLMPLWMRKHMTENIR